MACISQSTYHPVRALIESRLFQRRVQRHKERRVHDTTDRRLAAPLPRLVPVPKHDPVRDLERLPVLVRLKKRAAGRERAQRMRRAERDPPREHGRRCPCARVAD